MDLYDYLKSAKKSLFRLEYLQEYNVPEEAEFFEQYKKTGGIDTKDLMQEWWDFLKQKNDKGVIMQRVRLVKKPITKYLEWELKVYKETARYGEEIKLLPEYKSTPELDELGDFWLVDDSVGLKMNYDESGQYESFELVSDIKLYLNAKKYLLENSECL